MEEQIMTLLGHARQQLGVGPGRLDDWRSDVTSEMKWTEWLPSRELTYPQKIAFWNFEDDFPFPQVGYVNSLEGKYDRNELSN